MKTLNYLLSLGFFFSVSAALAQDHEAIKKDMEGLQGEWSMVSGSADGQPMPEEMRKQMKRVCKGDVLTVAMGTQTFLKAKITIDPSSKPKTIDYEMTDGLTKGKKQLGIYELNGDTLKSCFAAPGAERPPDFEGKAGDHRTLSVWKRENPRGALKSAGAVSPRGTWQALLRNTGWKYWSWR
jgi:uncharacterized protein (TIGR03067 family)